MASSDIELSQLVLTAPQQTAKPFVGYLLAYDGGGTKSRINAADIDATLVGLGNLLNTKLQPNGTSAPSQNDDSSAGYSVFSRWVYAGNEYVLVDSSVGAAVWVMTTSGAADGVDGNVGQIQLRRNTALGWTASNPVLHAGEIGYETDTGFIKIGDNVLAWSALDYVTHGVIDSALVDLLAAATATADAGTLVIRDESGAIVAAAPTSTDQVALLATAYAAAADFRSTTAPSSPVAGMRWMDTTANVLKQRNATNSGWNLLAAYAKTADPGVSDDSADGYVAGSRWYTVSPAAGAPKTFELKDPLAGGAVWVEVGAAVTVGFGQLTGAARDAGDLAAELDAKEDAIGAKGTAFNVDFGTGAGDAVEGTHVGSRDGHPLATTFLDGLMPAADHAALADATSGSTGATLAKRDSGGNISVGTTSNDAHAISRGEAATAAGTIASTAVSGHVTTSGAHGSDVITNQSTVTGASVSAALDAVYAVAAAAGNLQWDPLLDVLNTPVGSPSTGQGWLVGTSPTGAFVGHGNARAVWGGSSYTFTAPAAGQRVVIKNLGGVSDSNVGYVYGTTTWSPQGTANADGIADGTTKGIPTLVQIADIPSAGEKAALAGTSGTPGPGNKFVTDAAMTAHTGLATAHAARASGTEITSAAGTTTNPRTMSPSDVVSIAQANALPQTPLYAYQHTAAVPAPTQSVNVLRAGAGDFTLPLITGAAQYQVINRSGGAISLTTTALPVNAAHGWLAREESLCAVAGPPNLPTTQLSMSCWLLFNRSSDNIQHVLSSFSLSTADRVEFGLLSSGRFGFLNTLASGSVSIEVSMAGAGITDGWHHVDLCFSLTAGVAQILIDGVPQTLAAQVLPSSGSISWGNTSYISLGGRRFEGGSVGWKGGIAQFWMAPTYLDRTVSAVGKLTYNNGQVDLGATGVAGGATPSIYVNTDYNTTSGGQYPNAAPTATDVWVNQSSSATNVAVLPSTVPTGLKYDTIDGALTFALQNDSSVEVFVENVGGSYLSNWVTKPSGAGSASSVVSSYLASAVLDITANVVAATALEGASKPIVLSKMLVRTTGGTCTVALFRGGVAIKDSTNTAIVAAITSTSGEIALATGETLAAYGKITVTVTSALSLTGLEIFAEGTV